MRILRKERDRERETDTQSYRKQWTHLPLSMRQTDRSLPVSTDSCFNRIDAAKPAGPPPTINTSKGMDSRGSSISSSAPAAVENKAESRGDAKGRAIFRAVGVASRRLAFCTRRLRNMVVDLVIDTDRLEIYDWQANQWPRESLYGAK
jgi:hypothetical protein